MKKYQFIVLIFVIIVFGLFITGSFKKDLLLKPELLGSKGIHYTLSGVVSDSLKDTKGAYALVIKNMKTGKDYKLNEDKVYEAGSLYKLWVMATAYEEIKKGELKEDEILSEKIEILNQKFEIEEEEAELTEGIVTMTVQDALNQMISISHNYAALLLTEEIGNSQVKKFLKENGFLDSDLGIPPKTTASDIALFFEKLYRGELVSKEYSQKMIDLLIKQQLNDGLPKYLPKGTEVAHKTGDIGWFKHDGGIVFTDKGDYIIVVFSETSSPAGAQERIAQLSKEVYEYFTKR